MSRVTSSTGQSRRRFLKQTTTVAAAAAAASLWTKPAWSGAAGANERRINLGFIGPGGQGMNLLQSFVQLPGVEVTWLCDVDDYRMAIMGAACLFLPAAAFACLLPEPPDERS